MSEAEEALLAVAGQEPTTPATIETVEGGFVFRLKEWIEQPEQVHMEDRGDAGMAMWMGHPVNVVNDFEPRSLWGLRGGEKFTVLDARMHVDDGSNFLPLQRYEASRLLDGAHVNGPDTKAVAVRYDFSRPDAGWLATPGIATRAGLLEAWQDELCSGLIWTPHEGESIHRLAHRFPTTLTALLHLWTGRSIDITRTQILLPDGQWYPLVEAREPQPARRRPTDLLDLSSLDLGTVATWLDVAHRMGPVPHIAVHEGLPVQAGAQVIATALESFHRRLEGGVRRFPPEITTGQLARAKKAARNAAVESLAEVAVDLSTVRQAFDEALGHIDEPTYADRLHQLLPDVAAAAPGLLGPDLSAWIDTMKEIRNVQSHGTPKHDAFDQDEISRYYVHQSSGRWALKILLLRQLIDDDRLRDALARSNTFHYSLANLDREHLWSGFSAYDTFTKSQP